MALPKYFLIGLGAMFANVLCAQPVVTVGSKVFNESYILAEMAALLLEEHGFQVQRRIGLGGTLIAHQALVNGGIDLYPEYTGTISQVILKNSGDPRSAGNWETLQAQLLTQNLQLLQPLGFNNSYAIALHENIARERGITNLTEFAQHADLRVAVSLEFLNRDDGWPALSRAYQLQQNAIGIEHALAYRAIANRELDATDAYTTDGEIDSFPLVLLEDDKHFFPEYLASFFTRTDLAPEIAAVLNLLAGRIDAGTMRKFTAQVSLDKQSPAAVAAGFLQAQGLIAEAKTDNAWISRVIDHTITHLQLTGIALLLATALAIPGALMLSRTEAAAKILLYVTGLFQTVPALALLALLIPVFGLGKIPAIIALFLYSLLPIFRNTLTGVFNVDPVLKQVAKGMGLTTAQQILRIELPLAAPTIIAGIKTAAIISIGTATLAAFVGAGGLGEPIITGLTLNDHRLILQGAIPAAVLAIMIELLFEQLDKYLRPQYLTVNK